MQNNQPEIAGHRLIGEKVPLVMGILNVTPDSFSDGGRFETLETALEQALRLVDEGADILDIGGESTRPGADLVPVEEELARVVPLIEQVRQRSPVLLSIDTRKAQVMQTAVAAGADIINDVTALTFEPESLIAASSCDAPIILMHGKGDPKTMQDNPVYDDVLAEVMGFLRDQLAICAAAGISRDRLVVDPGIGFGKTLEHNLTLLANLHRFHELGVPVLLGASRKRFIGALSGESQADRRAPGSIAAALSAVQQGVQILRVHDVGETRQALAVWQGIEAA
jgi:dihydropteroate synthase